VTGIISSNMSGIIFFMDISYVRSEIEN